MQEHASLLDVMIAVNGCRMREQGKNESDDIENNEWEETSEEKNVQQRHCTL